MIDYTTPGFDKDALTPRWPTPTDTPQPRGAILAHECSQRKPE